MNANKILGIDFGTKRIGVALSDESQTIGQPYIVVKNTKTCIDEILEIIKKENVSIIVIGESKDFKGQDNPVMGGIRDFKKIIEERSGLQAIFEPEFLSSHQAEKIQGKNEMLDASAAAIILQSYLDRNKNKMEPKKEIKEIKPTITIDDFAKVEIRAGKILKVEPIPASNKLLKLEVDFGEEKPRQVLSGIAKHFPDPNVLAGKVVGFVTNLQPRQMMGMESQGMILAVSTDTTFSLLSIDPSIPPGIKIK